VDRKLGAYIRDQRNRLGWSQQMLARKINHTPAALAKIESGENLPNRETLLRLAREMIVDTAELFRLLEHDRQTQDRPRSDRSAVGLTAKGVLSVADLISLNLQNDPTLARAASVLEKILMKETRPLCQEVLRVFAKEACADGSHVTSSQPVSSSDDVAPDKLALGKRILKNDAMRGAYQDLKTCLANPKVGPWVTQLLDVMARA